MLEFTPLHLQTCGEGEGPGSVEAPLSLGHIAYEALEMYLVQLVMCCKIHIGLQRLVMGKMVKSLSLIDKVFMSNMH